MTVPPALRNILIIAVIAALIVIVPGGGTGASVVGQGVYLVFLGAIVWFAALQYRQHRVAIYSLGDRNRTILYAALGVLTLTLIASGRMWHTGAGLIAWFVLVAACVYAVFAILWTARRY
jgi:hypothetical protein